MAIPALIQVATGTIDGVNTVFETSADYVTGSVQVFLNGQLKRVDLEDGWVELGGKKVKLNEPPIVGDVVQIYYRPI